MAKIKFDDKLTVERFPQQREWIEPMFRVINDFFAQVGSALKGRLTFLDNFLGEERLFDFVYQSQTLTFPQKFQWGLVALPRALQVVSAKENDEPVILCVAWEYTAEGQVQLTDMVLLESAGPSVAALTVGARYKIVVRVTP